MNCKNTLLVIHLLFFSCILFGQKKSEHTSLDQWSYGLGLGQDFGGFGANVLVYPQKNIGVFIGGGYAYAGFGHNIGLKARLVVNNQKSIIYPYLLAMHGYHTAIKIEGASNFNKLFYGFSFGLGFDMSFRPIAKRSGYWSFAIIFPSRGDGVDNYKDRLSTYGVKFKNQLSPVTFSFGHHFIINKK